MTSVFVEVGLRIHEGLHIKWWWFTFCSVNKNFDKFCFSCLVSFLDALCQIKNFHYNCYFPSSRRDGWTKYQSGSTFLGSAPRCQTVLLWKIPGFTILYFGNSTMNILWGIGRMIMTRKSLHQCHFVHLIPHMNWLGIRTWVPAVRDATNGLNQGTVAGRTLETREIPVRTAERKNKTGSVFSAQNGFHRVLRAALHWVFPLS